MVNSIDRITSKVELSKEIAQIALSCPSCRGAVRDLIQNDRSRHQGGGRSSFAAMNETDGLDNDYSTLEYK